MDSQPSPSMSTPIIVKLGERKPELLEALEQGEGKLMSEVVEIVAEVQEQLKDKVEGKILLPIILVYQEKTAKTTIERILDTE